MVRKCASRLMDHSLSAENLLSRRAVVGWWGESEVILNGAADDGPSVRYSNTEPAKKYVKVSEVSLGFQQILAGEVKISLAARYSKRHFPRSGPYPAILRCASRTPVLLFDQETRRGWMLPASLVLLLTAHQRIAEGPWPQPSCFQGEVPRSAAATLTFLEQAATTQLSDGYCIQDMILVI